MTTLRKRKEAIIQALLHRNRYSSLEDRQWDQMRPVGREFGSPDFERLMDEDRRNGVGIFDPAQKGRFGSDVQNSDGAPGP
ncbi:MAG TPA: hypothetical protein VGM81_25900 [Burkholderiaceae bacterium]|jgi:hypothetical protein